MNINNGEGVIPLYYTYSWCVIFNKLTIFLPLDNVFPSDTLLPVLLRIREEIST